MSAPIRRKLWLVAGRVLYLLTQPGIRLVVHNSHRTRILVICGDEYLLVKHWLGKDFWMLPGGGCHKGEDPVDGALRELHEEVGIDLGHEAFNYVGQYLCHDDGFHFSYDLYVVRMPDKPELRLQRIEIHQADWFKLTDKSPASVSPEVKVGLKSLGRKVGHAR